MYSGELGKGTKVKASLHVKERAAALNKQYRNKIKKQEKEITWGQKELNERRQNFQELESRGQKVRMCKKNY